MKLTRRAALCSTIVVALAQLAVEAEAAERHPAIRSAIRALEKAKDDLQRADHDFGGHRADALAECDRAIAQLRLALQFDRK